MLPPRLTWTCTASWSGDAVSEDRAARPSGGDDPARDAARDREAKRTAAAGGHGRGVARALPVSRLRPLHRGLDPDDELPADRGGLPASGRRLCRGGEAARGRLPRGDLLADRADVARGGLGRDLHGLLRRSA